MAILVLRMQICAATKAQTSGAATKAQTSGAENKAQMSGAAIKAQFSDDPSGKPDGALLQKPAARHLSLITGQVAHLKISAYP
jgi:hypothetical protein